MKRVTATKNQSSNNRMKKIQKKLTDLITITTIAIKIVINPYK